VEGDPLARSPFGTRLGMRLVELGEDRAVVALPHDDGNSNTSGILHGGAIGSLVDMAAGVATTLGSGTEPPPGATTVSMTIDFVDGVRGEDVEATARVLRRGRALCFSEVEVTAAGGRLVAKALVTYRLAT
jgi:uncharacterized protein (TIGR00369 family)